MKQIIISALSLLLISCNSSLEIPDDVKKDDVMLLSADRSTLTTRGKDTTNIVARIPKDAGLLDIKFTTTQGTFIAATAKTINQYADSLDENYRYAIVRMTSDTTHGPVYITAEVAPVRRRIEIMFIK